MNLVPSVRFINDLEKLEKGNIRLKASVRKRLNLLRSNIGHPSLRLHKLSGKDIYSISVTMSVRIVFLRRGDEVYLLRIGSHEEVY